MLHIALTEQFGYSKNWTLRIFNVRVWIKNAKPTMFIQTCFIEIMTEAYICYTNICYISISMEYMCFWKQNWAHITQSYISKLHFFIKSFFRNFVHLNHSTFRTYKPNQIYSGRLSAGYLMSQRLRYYRLNKNDRAEKRCFKQLYRNNENKLKCRRECFGTSINT